MGKTKSRRSPSPAAAPEPVAQPMNSPEDRWINRARAAGSTRTDAELRQQYHDRVASRGDSVKAQSGAAPETAKAPKKAKVPSAARQAAVSDYKAAFGKEPPARMSAKAIKNAIETGRVAAVRQAARREQVSGTFGTQPNQAKAKAAMPPTRSSSMRSDAARHDASAAIRDAQMRTMAAQRMTPPATPPSAPPSLGQSARNAYAKAATPLGVYSAGVQIASAYQRARADGADVGQASIEGVKAGAVPAAILAANPIEHVAGRLATSAFTLGGEAVGLGVGSVAVGATGVGIAAKGLQIAAKVAGRVALPAIVGYSAYQGAKEDRNTIRGTMRGALRGLDPTSIFMARGFGERAFDAAFGQATPQKRSDAPVNGRLSADQRRQFLAANATHQNALPAPKKTSGDKAARGWANPKVQMAAQKARGVQNVTDWAQSGENYDGNSLMTRGR